ncbi:MAG: hypothetical protein KME28_22075 [Pelatocladus maniniholoensis HA4357-MV3]|jgi:hypothetical protein|uniref:Uncharacterized protein n=1 Tax=Pelatocladus maniniholoensis HA4357-MV3 TaxID=1117104 RepID=A0A9E3HBQ6_9NOST|nr:hypothetical protein [Pelatocladus maniniholoensis HA4357-MV3]
MSNGVDKQLDKEQKVSASREWTEAAFANLLNVEDGSVIRIDTYDKDEVKQKQNQPTEHQTSYVNPNVVTQGELFDDPHSGKTQPTLASNPFAKFGTVGLGFGVVFVIAASVASRIMTVPRVAPPMAKTTPEAKPEVVVAEKQEVETGKYKAELALDEQAQTIKLLKSSKSPKTSATKPNSQDKNEVNKQTTKDATPPSFPVQASYIPQPIPKRELYRYQQATISQPQPTVNPVPTHTKQSTQSNEQSTDPQQQWFVAANVGSLNLGNNDSSKTDVTSVKPTSDTRIQTVSQPTDNQINTLNQNYPYTNSGNEANRRNGSRLNRSCDEQRGLFDYTQKPASISQAKCDKQILVGSRTLGVLETPIVWSGNSNNTEQKYLIRLTQPLKADDNSVSIKANSYIVVKISNANAGEFVQLTAISALVNENGGVKEKVIPENTILILGNKGEALRGKARKGSTLVGDLMASVLSGVGQAAEIYNRQDSEINISGNTTIVTSSDRRNLGVGFAEGSFKEMVRRMQTANQQRLQSMKSQPKVYLIEQGTSVQLFVNQTIFL